MKFQGLLAERDPSLAQAAYAAIKKDIVRCRLEPGRQVTEAELVERYAFGRAPIRTALNRLYQERLVGPIPRRGYVIAPITLRGVQELFAVRLLLEPAAARLAAAGASEGQLGELGRLSAARYSPGDPDSAEAFWQGSLRFHTVIAEASGNQRLAEMIVGLLDEMGRVFHLNMMLQDRNEVIHHGHRDLIVALQARDGERAERISARQIQVSRTLVTDVLVASPYVQSVNLFGNGPGVVES